MVGVLWYTFRLTIIAVVVERIRRRNMNDTDRIKNGQSIVLYDELIQDKLEIIMRRIQALDQNEPYFLYLSASFHKQQFL